MDLRNPPLYRVVTIGDSSVGKTSLIKKMVYGSFSNDEQATVGASFVLFNRDVNGTKIDMQVWDTAGQEKFRSLGPIYYRGAAVGIMVTDITQQYTIETIDEWVETFKRIAGPSAIIVLAVNKIDLIEEQATEREAAETKAKEFGIPVFFTSAKSGDGVSELIQYIASQLEESQRRPKTADVSEGGHVLTIKEDQKNSCC